MENFVNLKSDSKSVPNIPSADAGDFGRDGLWSDIDMLQFWEASRSWLAERGFHLFETYDKPINNVYQVVWLRPLTYSDSKPFLPYATCIPPEPSLPRPMALLRQLGYAHDKEGRNVVIRLVQNDSYHHRIFRRLLEDETFSHPTAFPGVLPPVAILDTPHAYSFVIMPMWGELFDSTIHDMETVREVIHFMDCLLQGLTLLHKHKIVHRDITPVNIMVNCYRYDNTSKSFDDDLRQHRKNGMAYYALMDFDQSLILPADVDIRTCRRPSIESFHGNAVYKPWDVSHGEPTYNPFAFDVGMLGNLFSMELSDAVAMVPACAALFDRMTTHVISRRFTAEEALGFLRETTAALTQAELETQVKLDFPEFSDRYWDKLSPEQCSKWKHFRTPKESWVAHILEFLARYQTTYKILAFVRRVLNI